MYALVVPPELVARLYRLREQHARGPIRRQILKAVERYLDEVEQELAVGAPSVTGTAAPENSPTGTRS